MNNNDERDYDEEQYSWHMCPACDRSPCMSGNGKGGCEACCDLYRQTGHLHNNMCGGRRYWER